MQKILILKGLPASGKSTYAKELLKKEPGKWKRVNKDDLRAMLDNSRWSKANEKFILKTRDEITVRALVEGQNVIIDDTNLSKIHESRIREIALLSPSIEVEVKFFDTPLEECIQRDSKRANPVGEKVIRDMHKKYFGKVNRLPSKPKVAPYDPTLLDAIICDIDGTLALMGNRSPYDWDKVGIDTINRPVLEVITRMADDYRIILLSGRDSSCRAATEFWLDQHDVPYGELHMRREGDNRKDSIIKNELYEDHVKGKYNVKFVLDDRNQVVQLWRSLGLTCFQVADGNF